MKRLLGGLLLAIGALIAGASGLCSLIAVVPMLGIGAEGVMLWLMWGGIPFAIGLGLFKAGKSLIRSADFDDYGR